ncbi:CAP domain-containing protein (plasmid) [Paraburkholderia sprentiae WSM5005]|uniref:CAP domain-containing protein n=2 Tax=Paraburkholderia sprentiae TaxID=948107 RepID=A0A1I9YW85_9BURK|nr:CAP domain-containing protein [Paraburkholderia sprentiae WSM5005]
MTAFSIAAALALSACGGGGGGSDSGGTNTGSSSTPAATSSSAGNLQTSVPTATYTSGTAEASIFTQLNAYRSGMGVGLLKQDTMLDTSASAHALYLVDNFANGNITSVTHNEVSTLADYYEATPLSRARKAGVPATEWVGENAGVGLNLTTVDANATSCVGQYLDTVYHLQGATDIQETVGVGFQVNASQGTYGCVLDFGETTNVTGAPVDNGFYAAGGQQMATSANAVSPYPNETNVALTMHAESPNPAPDLASPGRPVMFRVNAANAGDVLTVTSFTLTANGSAVPARIIVPSAAMTGSTGATADVNNALFVGVVVLLPLAPLAANTTYTATFSGQRDGKPVSRTWNFTTGS